LAVCLFLSTACTSAEQPPLAALTSDDRVVVAVIDEGTVDVEQPWIDGYSVAIPEPALPSDHTSQVVSVLVGAGRSTAVHEGLVDILILPVNLTAADPSNELVHRWTEHSKLALT
jgi:hypothetical protein